MDKRYKDHEHKWLPIFLNVATYSGIDWCELCGSIKILSKKGNYYYRYPGSIKNKFNSLKGE